MSESPLPARAARAGRAMGAMFFAGFGAVWLVLWAISEYRSLYPLAAIALAAVVLLWRAYRAYRIDAPALRALGATPRSKRMSRAFHVINAAQWLTTFVVAVALMLTGRSEFILPSIVFIVGLHFIPLARLFAYWPHYLTGCALMLLATIYPFVAADGAASSTGALGAGVILWASSIAATLAPSG